MTKPIRKFLFARYLFTKKGNTFLSQLNHQKSQTSLESVQYLFHQPRRNSIKDGVRTSNIETTVVFRFKHVQFKQDFRLKQDFHTFTT